MRRVLLVLGALGLLAGSAQPAFAGTTVGETFQPDTSGATCYVNPGQESNVLQTGRASGPSYAVPSAGVLTSWSFESGASGASDTTMNMRVFRPTGMPQEYTAVADGSPLQTIQNGSGLNTFPTRITVQAGDYVGIRSTSGVCAKNTGNAADTFDHYFTAPLAIGVPQGFTSGPYFIWDVSAVLEPDADHDTYGDESQDFCSTDVTTQGPCQPRTVTFGSQTLDTQSSPQTLTLSNTSPNTALPVSSISTGGDFAVTGNNCGATIAVGTSCTVGVAFQPTAVGGRAGTLSIADAANGSPHTIALSGTGTTTGERAAALKKCKKKHSPKRRKKCRKKAKRLPV